MQVELTTSYFNYKDCPFNTTVLSIYNLEQKTTNEMTKAKSERPLTSDCSLQGVLVNQSWRKKIHIAYIPPWEYQPIRKTNSVMKY